MEKTSEDLIFTGERFLPREGGLIRFEHQHRYVLASFLAEGRDVLDIACGEGYGTARLGLKAASVVGVDIDLSTVEYAQKRYRDTANIRFLAGSCDAIPIPDASVDLVVSFETIEHHDAHEAMMTEIRRVLRPNGVLLLSSPNRRLYSDARDYHNPFHVHELYRNELMDLLGRYFKVVHLYGQNAGLSSYVFTLEGTENRSRQLMETQEVTKALPVAPDEDAALYYIAVCANEVTSLPITLDSTYLDLADPTLKQMDDAILHLEREEKQLRIGLQELEGAFRHREVLLVEANQLTHKVSEELRETLATLRQTQENLQQTEAQLQRLENLLPVRILRKMKQILRGSSEPRA